MIKAVIFDFDGLMVETETVSFKVYRKILANYGIDYQLDTYVQDYSGHPETENVANLINTYNLPLSYDQLFALVITTEKELLSSGVDLKPGLKELLIYLKNNNYKIAIASSSLTDRAMKILDQHGINGYFDAFVFAEDITNGKPDPEIFLKAAEKLEVSPSDCLVLEDSEAGIEAADSASMKVICIPDMKTPGPLFIRKIEAILYCLAEVIPFLSEAH